MCSKKSFDWWQLDPVYQIYPRSFGDSNGDGLGDLNGIIEKIDYLKWLGIRIVWLSPIYQSPMEDNGYDISDFCQIDPSFGSLGDFEALVQSLHDAKIRLILDFVPCHTSHKHEWFQKSVERIEPYSSFYVWHDGKRDAEGGPGTSTPNNWQSCFRGPAWTWCPQRQQFYYHAFSPEQPSLNYRSKPVLETMCSVLDFWINLGVDGFRIDALNHILQHPDFPDNPQMDSMSQYDTSQSNDKRKAGIKAVHYDRDQPEFIELTGDWMEFLKRRSCELGRKIVAITESYTSNDVLTKLYERGVDLPMNFSLLQLKKPLRATRIRRLVRKYLREVPVGWPSWVLGNHDLSRMSSRCGHSGLVTVLNALLLLLPGTPVCYYGDELGMLDVPVPFQQCQDVAGRRLGAQLYASASRDPCRSPMIWTVLANAGFCAAGVKPWLPISASFEIGCVESQKRSSKSPLNNFRELLQLRKWTTFRTGSNNVKFGSAVLEDGSAVDGKVLVFARHPASSTSRRRRRLLTFLVVLNFSDCTFHNAKLQFAGRRWQCRSDAAGKILFDSENGPNSSLSHIRPFKSEILIGKRAAFVIKIKI